MIDVTQAPYGAQRFEDTYQDYNSTAAFTSAAADAAATGQRLHIPWGNFRCDIPLAGREILVTGERNYGTRLHSFAQGYSVDLGSLNMGLAEGPGAERLKIICRTPQTLGVRISGADHPTVRDIEVEGTISQYALTLSGGSAAVQMPRVDNIYGRHVLGGVKLERLGLYGVIGGLLENVSTFGAKEYGSVAFDIGADCGAGTRIVGGNAENCLRGIKYAGYGVSVAGLRFEGNTVDIETVALPGDPKSGQALTIGDLHGLNNVLLAAGTRLWYSGICWRSDNTPWPVTLPKTWIVSPENEVFTVGTPDAELFKVWGSGDIACRNPGAGLRITRPNALLTDRIRTDNFGELVVENI